MPLMSRIRLCVLLLSLSFLLAVSAQAATYSLNGAFKQGGLVFGTVTPGSLVSLDATDIAVSKEGLFLLGFGRDHGVKSHLMITYPDGQQVSETLKIAKQNFKIQRIDGLPKKKVTPNPEAVKRIRADNAAVGRTRQVFTAQTWFASGFMQPVEGRISGVFGSQRILNGKPRSPHKGLDIAAPKGTLIKADGDGVISLVHPDMYLMGKCVMIDHGHGLQSIYIHMDDILVKEGQFVKKGDPVGKVGMTGRATGPHLHWGVSLKGIALDPQLLVK
ncbi:periplasmic metalloprotease M23B family protein [Terasakiella brassicae]|uniref:Periplasmic metalloprotease M23B family protein n=1 Tax=Terasakiella brassicae TaxID=1634917 RepID=A0A917C244_9PROT|nr:M23 family metallopeptidase [Terasakiella brassicae]GGF68544.1 periplasmic metalloprotease M23B family protein [Terasakiella brassicae]